ncbi:MAG: hypothetical protein RL375_3393 [Pseudomonadota bacterium]
MSKPNAPRKTAIRAGSRPGSRAAARAAAQVAAIQDAQLALVNLMSKHLGRDKGIGVRQLASALSQPERRVRHLITRARRQGIPICGTPQSGYFIAVTADEIADACAFLRKRALHSLQLMSVMLGVSMPTLAGQLLLAQG